MNQEQIGNAWGYFPWPIRIAHLTFQNSFHWVTPKIEFCEAQFDSDGICCTTEVET